MITTDKKQINKIAWLCAIVYFISYLTRLNYGAVVSNIAENTAIPETSLSLAPTALFITYGIGQLVSGFLGDRIQPKLLVGAGLVVTAVMNILVPFCETAEMMSIFWGINGIAQAFMWPPIVKLMLSIMSGEEYKKQTFKVLYSSMCSTMFIYLITPPIVSLFSWKGVFFFGAIAAVLGLILWLIVCPVVDLHARAKVDDNGNMIKEQRAPFAPVLIFVLFAIVCMGALRDGVTTWLPSYVRDAFNLGSQTAIFTGAVIPLFTMVCYSITAKLYKTKLKNPMACAGVIFGVGLVAAGVLALLTNFGASNVVFSVVLASLLTGCMHGVNLILISMLPAYFRKKGNTSMMTGILNCCVYVGSAISTYLFPLIAKGGDWGATIFIWFIIAVVGTAICLLTVKPWKRFEKTLEE